MAKGRATYSIVLFKKQPKNDGTFPLKLRITYERKQKYYGIGWSFNESDWKKINNQNARGEHRDIKLKLAEIEQQAKQVIEYLEESGEAFAFARFEELFFNHPNNTEYVFEAFKQRIEALKEEGRISSSVAVSCASKSFESYFKGKPVKFKDITPDVLKDYENWMYKVEENSLTSVGIYMRSLRALFNYQIAKGLLDNTYYPFGRYKYQIPQAELREKVISKEHLQKLYEHKPEPFSWEDKGKDLWFFLYLCNGMNVKDMCRLKYSAFKNDYFVFTRAKTAGRNKQKKEISVILNDAIKQIIEKWGNKCDDSVDTYVFPFFYEGIKPEDEYRITQNLTGVINDNMNRIAKKLKLDIKITTYSARQTFSNVLLNSDAPIKLISDSLGHTTSAITEKHYLKKFTNEKLKQFNTELLNFAPKEVNN